MQLKKIGLGFVLLLAIQTHHLYAQVLETEESKPLLPGQFEIGTGLEYQTSVEGTETALPLAIEYGLSKRFTLLIEPVAFTNIQPKVGEGAKGIGELELTLFYQIMTEKKWLPATSISAEVKIPTAKDSLIGTGKIDYTPFLLMSKNIGKFFASMNLSYTFLVKPEGVEVRNLFNYAIGTIFRASAKSILFGEMYGNAAGVEGPDNASSEISGGELVVAGGYGYYLNKELRLSFGVSYDNNNAVLYRPGIEW